MKLTQEQPTIWSAFSVSGPHFHLEKTTVRSAFFVKLIEEKKQEHTKGKRRGAQGCLPEYRPSFPFWH